jgi:hypothetical protein
LLYVYAFLSAAPRALPTTGIAGSAVSIRPVGSVFTAVSEVSERPEIQEQSLREHDQTVRAIAECADAILPARFGSVVADDETLADLLYKREPELRSALALVTGCEQMTLRVYGETAPKDPQPAAESDLGPGARYLAAKVRDREGGLAGLDAVRPGLSCFIRAEHIQRHDTPPLLASVYHLIERGQSSGYLTTVAAVNTGADDGSRPWRLAASGPWPPYAFGRWDDT